MESLAADVSVLNFNSLMAARFRWMVSSPSRSIVLKRFCRLTGLIRKLSTPSSMASIKKFASLWADRIIVRIFGRNCLIVRINSRPLIPCILMSVINNSGLKRRAISMASSPLEAVSSCCMRRISSSVIGILMKSSSSTYSTFIGIFSMVLAVFKRSTVEEWVQL